MLVFSEKLWPRGSGGELATYLYLKLLTKENMNVKIIVASRHSRPISSSKLLIYVTSSIGYGKYTLLSKSERLKELMKWADVTYFTGLFNLIPLAKSYGKPVIAHIHSYFPVCTIGSLYNFVRHGICEPSSKTCSRCIWYYERAYGRSYLYALASVLLNSRVGGLFLKFLSFADVLIFVSNAQKELFLRHAPNFRKRSYVIYNPLPDISYTPIKGDNVGYFGGLNPLKGFHVLLRAWLKIFPKHPGARLFTTKMSKLTNNSMLKRLHVIAYGKLKSEELDKLYSNVRVVAFPSIWQEPLPYVVMEALLHGRLLVASNVGGVPEIVDGVPGVRLVPPDNIDALADALDWALSMDRRDAVELGLRNREIVLGRFNSEESVRKLIKVFKSVI